MMTKIQAIELSAEKILQGNITEAQTVMDTEYPFQKITAQGRKYTDKEKMEQFVRDGFIDRYSGQKLVNPGLLKVLSHYMPETVPYHAHWKMESCHNAYWEFVPTVDHIYPMLHNSIKSNWTLAQLNWKLHDAGNYNEYDGLTEIFIKLVRSDEALLKDAYIKKWYRLSVANK